MIYLFLIPLSVFTIGAIIILGYAALEVAVEKLHDD